MSTPSTHQRLITVPGWLILMGLITALGPLAIDMYLPAFPAMAQSLNISGGHIERTLASYLFGIALAQLVYGPLADRFGRKKPLMLGLSIFIIASIGCASASNIEQLLGWRIIQAFGGAAGMVVPKAVIRDNFNTRDAAKALSIIMLVMGATPILAPLFGAQILIFANWRWIFHFMTLVATLLLLSIAFSMKESLDPDKIIALNIRTVRHNYWALIRHKRFVCYTLAGGFGMAGMFAYIAGSPRIFMEIYGINPSYFSLLFGLNAGALIIMSQVSARLLNKYNPETLLTRSQTLLLVATLAGLLLTLFNLLSLWLLMLCLITYMGCQGFVNPNSAALALREQGARLGAASALMGTLQMLSGALAGMLVSLWQAPSALPLTGLLVICAGLSWLCGFIAQKDS